MAQRQSAGIWFIIAAVVAAGSIALFTKNEPKPALPSPPEQTTTNSASPNTSSPTEIKNIPVATPDSTKTEPLPKPSKPPSNPPTSPKSDPDDAPPKEPPKLTQADRETATRALDNMQFALRDFRTALGGNPVGTNAEITRTILGDNEKQVSIPVPEGSTLNANRELCDSWGTPYFFHQISAQKMEIRSAGPDKQMWTEDDITM
jgi:type IV secretory pathway VirB10-like protein